MCGLYEVDGLQRLKHALRAAANGESACELDTQHARSDRIHTIRWHVRRLGDANFATYEPAAAVRPDFTRWAALALGIDVTARIERERRTAEDDAMSFLGTLTTSLAHEIRNPLNVAKLQLELIVLRAKLAGDEPLQERLAEPATLVRTAIGRMSILFEQFLEVAQPRPPVRTKISVLEIFDSVITLQQGLVGDRGIALRRFVREGGLMARCDADNIKRVLSHLIRNSVEALKERGFGQVALHGERRPDGGVSISVVDDGPGLASEMRGEAAFAAFATTKAAGTGLGLAIARKIVSQHGGTIELLAEPGLGTAARFWISK
jgi:signal transduction histidine kinase